MAERKATNKYYPPEWRPEMGSLNKFHGTHALRDRARKLQDGILIIRFEMPYNIWCNGCGSHIGMGVRYNAQKKRVGKYYSTIIYKFRMKCHLCPNHFEIQTDPQNNEYVILSGARRKEERWDAAESEAVQLMDFKDRQKLADDPMFKLEHTANDKAKAESLAPTLHELEELRNTWKDDYKINSSLRNIFRKEKKEIKDLEKKDSEFKLKYSLSDHLKLAPENNDKDIELSKSILFGKKQQPKTSIRVISKQVKQSYIFDSSTLKNSSKLKSEQAKKLLSQLTHRT